MAEENTTASGSGQRNGDKPPHKMIRLEELQATEAGLIRKNLKEAGLRANSVNANTLENKGEESINSWWAWGSPVLSP